MLLRSADLRSTPELIALAVNLAHSKRVAEVRATLNPSQLIGCDILVANAMPSSNTAAVFNFHTAN